MATWPSTLPVPQPSGYSVKPVDQTVRTDMETGSPRVRRRTTSSNDKISMSWDMSDDQLGIFRDWFDDATTGIAGGSVWFYINLLVNGGGFTNVEARFVGPYTLSYVPYMRWVVSGELEIR